MRVKLTKRLIDSTPADPSNDVFLWDTELHGFGVRIKPSGVKTFLIQYRNIYGQTRRKALGRYGRLTTDEARKLAKIDLGAVEKGEDPSADRKKARAAKTVSELCDTYYADAEAGRVLHRGRAKKASTLATDKGRIDRHIKPLIGTRPIDSLTRQDVERFMHQVREGRTKTRVKTNKKRGLAIVTGGAGTASKCVSLLSTMFAYAVRQGWVDHNPCRGIERPADKRRDRYLSADEYRAFGNALTAMEAEGTNKTALNAIRALSLTGCRRGEILSLRPTDINMAVHGLQLQDTKSGPQLRPCGQAALSFIDELASAEENWVFPATRGEGHFVGIVKPFKEACDRAGIVGVTLHTLRHSFATVAHELGYSELTIAGLLGHQAGSVTAHYAHHVDSALASAADKVSSVIDARMREKEPDNNVVSLHLPTVSRNQD